MRFIEFLATPTGRMIRMFVGSVMFVWGGTDLTTVGWIVLSIGAIPLLGGALNFCLLAPLFGAPINGERLLGHHAAQ